MPLNYYAISNVLGGRLRIGQRPRFGAFALLSTHGEMLKGQAADERVVTFTREMDRLVAAAFEEVREGKAPDRILWDKKLAADFYRAARKMGVRARGSELGRRLLNIRKSPKAYEKHGIVLSETTVTDPKTSIVWEHAHAVEYALMTLKYRNGASIDDILLDPDLAAEFDALAIRVSPALSSIDVRLAALYIRKTRHLAKDEKSLFEQLDLRALRLKLEDIGTIDSADRWSLPESEGLFQLIERRRTLFVGRSPNLKVVLGRLALPETLDGMSSQLWTPRPETITARVFVGDSLLGIGTSKWQLGLIQAEAPLLNWPVSK